MILIRVKNIIKYKLILKFEFQKIRNLNFLKIKEIPMFFNCFKKHQIKSILKILNLN